MVNGERIYEYGCPCGTCGIVFRKIGSTVYRLDDSDIVDLLGALDTVPPPPILHRLARVLEPGLYHPIIIEGTVSQIQPEAANDYFATDVVRLFGLEPPEYKIPSGPGTAYYKFGLDYELGRTGRISGPHQALVTAVVMPLHDPSRLNRARIEYWKEQHAVGHCLTAFALSVVDNQSPAMEPPDKTYKYKEQFLFTNCLIDGHHRIQAAAELGARTRILSLVSSKFSLVSDTDDLVAVLDKYIL